MAAFKPILYEEEDPNIGICGDFFRGVATECSLRSFAEEARIGVVMGKGNVAVFSCCCYAIR